MDRATTCCFTGHRPDKLPWGSRESDPRCLTLKRRLTQAVEGAYAQGMRHFICGMARGTDLYFAEAVLALRLERPVPLREKLSCLGILTALALAAVLPFALADPVFGLADYTVTPLRQILWGAMAVLVLLTVDALRAIKTK